MVKLIKDGAYLLNGQTLVAAGELEQNTRAAWARAGLPEQTVSAEQNRKQTMAHGILAKHNVSQDPANLEIKFDALTSHDITYVGIIQTAIASGLEKFPLPYVLTNCHNSLCAVGGTINEDDHVFGLSAAKKFGGIFVPPHVAVIHQYMREMMAGCGKMILGSDSHTRYGALGTMAIGEGGPELVKQLLGRTYLVPDPKVIAIYLTGKPQKGVGPQDVALAIEKEVFANGFVKNSVMEFVGPGVANLSMDFRIGIDVMSTETTCLSTIWRTDEQTKNYLTVHGRPEAYQELNPGAAAYYEGAVVVELDQVEPMIAMPFHPSNVFTIKEVNEQGAELLAEIEAKAVERLDNKALKLNLAQKYFNGKLHVDQGVIAGCSGGIYENLVLAANIVKGHAVGDGAFGLSVYPSSQPIYLKLMKEGKLADFMEAGAVIRTAFCGPCFGAGDTPCNKGFSIRHTTRNFPNREGSKPGNGQIASVALMDARSIAATAANGGVLTAATELDFDDRVPAYEFDKKPYENRVFFGWEKADAQEELIFGPAIKKWPKIEALTSNVLLKLAAVIHDPVTTTDELIPSGETSSYRSNPFALSEFTLSRKVPEYVGRAKAVQAVEKARQADKAAAEVKEVYQQVLKALDLQESEAEFAARTCYGSAIFANKPGDGSAREQAASCQRVLGGAANLALEYATKRYRSNVINWGMLPFLMNPADVKYLEVGAYVYVPNVREQLLNKTEQFPAYVIKAGQKTRIELSLGYLSDDEREIIARGCLINFYASGK